MTSGAVQRLSFVVLDAPLRASYTWKSIIRVLNGGAITRNLQELIVAIDSWGNRNTYVASTTKANCLFSAPFPLWEEIDTLLTDTSHCPRLTVVEIILESGTYDETINQDNILSIVGRDLPRLLEAGLLRARLCLTYNWRIGG